MSCGGGDPAPLEYIDIDDEVAVVGASGDVVCFAGGERVTTISCAVASSPWSCGNSEGRGTGEGAGGWRTAICLLSPENGRETTLAAG